MLNRHHIRLAAILSIWPAMSPAAVAPIDLTKLPPASARQIDFATDIKPLFEASCLKCHSGDKPKGKYSLVSRELAFKPGDDGPNIVPNKSGESRVIHFVAR